MNSLQWTPQQVRKAKEDFRTFVYIVWRSIGLPPPTPIQLDIAYHLQHPPSDRFILQGFRGVAKSFLTCALCVWRLWRNPLEKVEIISASGERADANAIFIRKIINTLPFLTCLRLTPEDKQKGLRDTQKLFDVSGIPPDVAPSVKSVGITGQITGSRATLLIPDDIEVPGNSGTNLQREKLAELVKEFDAIIKPESGSQIIVLGTPQNEASLYNELQKRGYRTMIWPVMFPETQEERDSYENKLSPFISKRYDENPQRWAGHPTEPSRFNEEEIAKRRLSYGRAGFALQFMLNTNLSDLERYPLKCADLIVADLDPKETSLKWSWASGPQQLLKDIPCVGVRGDYFYGPFQRSPEVSIYTGTVLAIDSSGRGKDETGYAIVKFLNGFLFLVDAGGYRDGYSDATLRSLATKAKFHGVTDVSIEPNFGDGMFTQLLTSVFNQIHPCAIKESKRSTSMKEARIIDTLEPILMQHRLIVHTQVIKDDYKTYEALPAYSLIYQLTRISKAKGALAHDDRLDALALACAFWLEVMAVNAQAGMEEHLEEFLEMVTSDKGVYEYREEYYRKRLATSKKKHPGKSATDFDKLFARRSSSLIEEFLQDAGRNIK